jgi:hypothetical protein
MRNSISNFRVRHAAALAIVGWYLMTPVRFPNPTVNPCLPLSQWTIFESFDTAAKCERKLRRLTLEELDSDVKSKTKKADDAYVFSHCIASDDPRLAK